MASQYGHTALMVAVMHTYSETVEVLVARGADVEAECLVSPRSWLCWH